MVTCKPKQILIQPPGPFRKIKWLIEWTEGNAIKRANNSGAFKASFKCLMASLGCKYCASEDLEDARSSYRLYCKKTENQDDKGKDNTGGRRLESSTF